MQKNEFLARLHKELSGLPQADVEERLNFYSEMIDDRMEEGLTEEAAVAAVGSADEIAGQLLEENNREVPSPEEKRKKNGRIALLAAGSPLWVSLLVAAFAVVISLMVSLWAVVASLWGAVGGVFGGVVGGFLYAVLVIIDGYGASGLFLIGCGFICAGMTILLFFTAKEFTKAMHWLTKKLILWLKTCFFAKKEVTP